MNHPSSSQLSAVQAAFSRLNLSLPSALASSLASSLIAITFIGCLPAFAQLPPVNMGRWVKQPGDNQYSADTQQSRHGGGAPAYQVVPQRTAVIPQQSAPMWRPTPRAKRSDISLEPIVCDEPIAPVGFAPLPESLDLPGLRGGSMAFAGGSRGGMGGGGGMGGASFSSSYQGSAPGMAGGGGAPARVESHQGYNTHEPGAFVKKKTPYGNANNGTGGGGGDVYASGDGAGGEPMSEDQRRLRGLGREPSLKKGGSAAPEAPQAVQVNQATTQDLSLPDDDNPNNNKRKSGSQAGKYMKNRLKQATRQMLRPITNMPLPRMPIGR